MELFKILGEAQLHVQVVSFHVPPLETQGACLTKAAAEHSHLSVVKFHSVGLEQSPIQVPLELWKMGLSTGHSQVLPVNLVLGAGQIQLVPLICVLGLPQEQEQVVSFQEPPEAIQLILAVTKLSGQTQAVPFHSLGEEQEEIQVLLPATYIGALKGHSQVVPVHLILGEPQAATQFVPFQFGVSAGHSHLQSAVIFLPPLQVPVQEHVQVSASGVPPLEHTLPHWQDFVALLQTLGEIQLIQALPFQLLLEGQQAEGSISQMLDSGVDPPPSSVLPTTKSQPTSPSVTRPFKTEHPVPVQPVSWVI